MTFKLIFKEDALKKWNKLVHHFNGIDGFVLSEVGFKAKRKPTMRRERIKSAQLSGMKNCYKIKLRDAGYRLVYEVRDKDIVIVVIAVGKRERNTVYRNALKRL